MTDSVVNCESSQDDSCIVDCTARPVALEAGGGSARLDAKRWLGCGARESSSPLAVLRLVSGAGSTVSRDFIACFVALGRNSVAVRCGVADM